MSRTSIEAEQVEKTIFDSVWDLFSGLKLALILILVLAAAALVGALLPQAPGDVASNPSFYNLWLEQRIRPRYGGLTDPFSTLQLFDLYHAWWFYSIMGLLALNVIICTLNRLPGIWSSVFSPRVRMNDAFYVHSPTAVRLAGKGLQLEHLRSALSRKRYVVKVEEGEGVQYLYGDRNGWAKLGTLATHLSLVLFLVGAVLGSKFGFSEDQVVIPEGQIYQVNRGGLQFAVRNDDFVVEFYPDGRPKDFRSDLVIIDGGKEVAKKTIRVNDPLIYKGVRFHQSFYGAFAQVDVRDANGNALYSGQMELQPQGAVYAGGVLISGGRQELDGQLTIGREQGMNFQVWDGQQAGQTAYVAVGQTGTVGSLRVALQGVGQYTGLRMASDPGAILIWIASGLIVLGIAITFYFPRRRIWGRVSDGEIAFGGTADRFVNLKDELATLADEVRTQVPGVEVSTKDPEPAGQGRSGRLRRQQ